MRCQVEELTSVDTRRDDLLLFTNLTLRSSDSPFMRGDFFLLLFPGFHLHCVGSHREHEG